MFSSSRVQVELKNLAEEPRYNDLLFAVRAHMVGRFPYALQSISWLAEPY